jgi:hypothetical protein
MLQYTPRTSIHSTSYTVQSTLLSRVIHIPTIPISTNVGQFCNVCLGFTLCLSPLPARALRQRPCVDAPPSALQLSSRAARVLRPLASRRGLAHCPPPRAPPRTFSARVISVDSHPDRDHRGRCLPPRFHRCRYTPIVGRLCRTVQTPHGVVCYVRGRRP